MVETACENNDERIDSDSEFIVEKGMVVAVLSYDPNPLSSKSSDRKCLVNIRDILKRYF